jgi:hypothetical protein
LPNCWRPIFLVLPKLYGCQVSWPNCWRCSYMTYKFPCYDLVYQCYSATDKNYRGNQFATNYLSINILICSKFGS